MRLSHLPLRLTTGAFILNSGLGKRGVDGATAAGMQGMATQVVPQAGNLPPEQFAKVLSAGEIALGAALLTPLERLSAEAQVRLHAIVSRRANGAAARTAQP